MEIYTAGVSRGHTVTTVHGWQPVCYREPPANASPSRGQGAPPYPYPSATGHRSSEAILRPAIDHLTSHEKDREHDV